MEDKEIIVGMSVIEGDYIGGNYVIGTTLIYKPAENVNNISYSEDFSDIREYLQSGTYEFKRNDVDMSIDDLNKLTEKDITPDDKKKIIDNIEGEEIMIANMCINEDKDNCIGGNYTIGGTVKKTDTNTIKFKGTIVSISGKELFPNLTNTDNSVKDILMIYAREVAFPNKGTGGRKIGSKHSRKTRRSKKTTKRNGRKLRRSRRVRKH
jgi:hypothetical protein